MPYIEGETLRGRLERERQLSMSDAVRIACQIADALGTPQPRRRAPRHQAGKHHVLGGQRRGGRLRDRPCTDGRDARAPHGLRRRRRHARLHESGQAASGGELDGRSDIYSLGCVVYEMLSRSVPFTAPNGAGRDGAPLGRCRSPDPQRAATVSDALERAVLTALAKVPADRFATAAQFAGALAAHAERRPGRRMASRSLSYRSRI